LDWEEYLHLLPHLLELLKGPTGVWVTSWIVMILWLGATRKIISLAVALTITGIVFGVIAIFAYNQSYRPAPNRDIPLLMSCASVMFSFAASLCFTVSVALGLSQRNSSPPEQRTAA
jgi:hypothetical protein